MRLDPRLAIAQVNLARALKQQGKLDEAEQHYRRALAINPGLAAAHNGLGSLLGARGRPAEAVRHFRAALAGGAPTTRRPTTTSASPCG